MSEVPASVADKRYFTAVKKIAGYIDISPTPYHAVECAARLLSKAGGRVPTNVKEAASPGLWYTSEDGALTAWRIGEHHHARSGLHIVGAHTDSPNIRIKPLPDRGNYGYRQLNVAPYGGVLLNSWLGRDLGLAGRISYRNSEDSVSTKLVHINEPLMHIPQLAIHLDREVNERGLVLNPQHQMSPIWGFNSMDTDLKTGHIHDSRGGAHSDCKSSDNSPEIKQALTASIILSCQDSDFLSTIATSANVDPDSIIGHDLMAFDLTPARFVGNENSMLASGRVDDLVSCFSALEALISISQEEADSNEHISLLCLFDHEEVRSQSATSAASPRMSHIIDMLTTGFNSDADDRIASQAGSLFVSADGGHATHPNYAERHDAEHPVIMNQGPMLKVNINQHYATDSTTGAFWRLICEQADVPVQYFVNRSDLPCGSTIGPIVATRFGIKAVDVGCPQLAMHSSRELCGVRDIAWLQAALRQFWLT